MQPLKPLKWLEMYALQHMGGGNHKYPINIGSRVDISRKSGPQKKNRLSKNKKKEPNVHPRKEFSYWNYRVF